MGYSAAMSQVARLAFALALALALVTVGCRRGDRGDPVARAVAAGVHAQLGVAVKRVRCTAARCDVTLAGGATLAITVSGEGALSWESEELVRTAPIASAVGAELMALGVDAAVDCGPPLIAAVADAPTRITCQLAGGGAAWVDVAADGGLAIELALDEVAVQARTEPPDPEGLDELSRALDSDQSEGSQEDDDGAADAGAGGSSVTAAVAVDAGAADAP
jgi:hypothetical protein